MSSGKAISRAGRHRAVVKVALDSTTQQAILTIDCTLCGQITLVFPVQHLGTLGRVCGHSAQELGISDIDNARFVLVGSVSVEAGKEGEVEAQQHQLEQDAGLLRDLAALRETKRGA